jgi:hypothetical protein
MQQSPLTKSRLLLVATAFPIAWLACFYSLVVRTRLAVGHWPYYAHPDPKDTGFDIHYAVVMVGLLAIPFLGLAASSLGLFSRLRLRDVPRWLVVAPILVAVVTIVYLNLEPGDFIGWFLD